MEPSHARHCEPCCKGSVGGDTASRERGLHLSSLPLDARLFARAVRCHWHMEDRLHWVLDMVFHEDLVRLRSGAGPQTWPRCATSP